ncbi:MAG: hypothetical protein ABI594_08400 [Ginsengibacter sp.]
MTKIYLSVIILLAAVINAKAQGCSDAGVCTIHSIKNNTIKQGEKEDKRNEGVVGFNFGKGEKSVSYCTTEIEYTRSVLKHTSVTGKIGYSFISGELANTNGFGDLFLSANHEFDTKKNWRKSFVVGLKIPFDEANIIKNGIHLPMPYQTSLGTTDLVLGINFMHKSFGATIAVQQPLKPINGNSFLPGDYQDNSLANKYLPTNEFSRKGDILLRLSYNFDINKKFSVRPSFLSIYHEGNDTYLDANKVRKAIANSNGITINGNIFFDYEVNKTSEFEVSFGTPFAVRTKRPDGLTRSFVAALNYGFKF